MNKIAFATGLLLVGTCVSAQAAPVISAVGSPVDLATMPGSNSDFTFFGNPAQFPSVSEYGGGADAQPTVLNDFSAAAGANAAHTYGGNGNYSTISGPAGSGDTSVVTGIVFQGGNASDLVDFTLGTPGSTFNFSAFNVYVMYGNAHDGYEHDTSLTLTLLPPASDPDQTPLYSPISPLSITDSNSYNPGANFSAATFQEFTVTGARAGDVLRIGSNGFGYLGGVSFSEAPEPQAYVLLGMGVLALAFASRRRSKLS